VNGKRDQYGGNLMKLRWLVVPALVIAFGSFITAQNRPVANKIGYIDSEKVVQAHPDFKKVQDVRTQAEKELKPLQDRLQPLQTKLQAGNATAAEQQQFQIARQALQDTAKRWTDRQQTALQPITEAIDKTVEKVAQQQAFAMVLDKKVAASSGLVIYASDDLDLTNTVIKALAKN
jgi:outer membrane protein